ncbi:nitrilase-related carbon-nitrogen hydrolase [Kribbella sp. NPDC054772]
MTIFRAAVVQFEAVPDQPAANLATVERLAREAVADGARLVVFPELCLLGYWHLRRHTPERLHELAEPADGPLVSRVLALAKELGAGLGVGFLESADGTLFNAYAVCLPDGHVHVHRKLHRGSGPRRPGCRLGALGNRTPLASRPPPRALRPAHPADGQRTEPARGPVLFGAGQ